MEKYAIYFLESLIDIIMFICYYVYMAHRSTIYLTDEEYLKLKELSYKEGRSMASIIRSRLNFGILIDETLVKGDIPKPVVMEVRKKDIEGDLNLVLCKHGRPKTYCTVSKCENYAAWR